MTKLDTKLVYETPLFVGQGTPLRNNLIAKVYISIHTLPPFRFEPVTSKNIYIIVKIIYP
jgi:hypothetical protein